MSLYKTASAIGLCFSLGGGAFLLSHLAGQIREGSAATESLIGGGAALALGSMFFLLGRLGQDVVRLKDHVADSTKGRCKADS